MHALRSASATSVYRAPAVVASEILIKGRNFMTNATYWKKLTAVITVGAALVFVAPPARAVTLIPDSSRIVVVVENTSGDI